MLGFLHAVAFVPTIADVLVVVGVLDVAGSLCCCVPVDPGVSILTGIP
jgi:hypothetical protein